MGAMTDESLGATPLDDALVSVSRTGVSAATLSRAIGCDMTVGSAATTSVDSLAAAGAIVLDEWSLLLACQMATAIPATPNTPSVRQMSGASSRFVAGVPHHRHAPRLRG